MPRPHYIKGQGNKSSQIHTTEEEEDPWMSVMGERSRIRDLLMQDFQKGFVKGHEYSDLFNKLEDAKNLDELRFLKRKIGKIVEANAIPIHNARVKEQERQQREKEEKEREEQQARRERREIEKIKIEGINERNATMNKREETRNMMRRQLKDIPELDFTAIRNRIKEKKKPNEPKEKSSIIEVIPPPNTEGTGLMHHIFRKYSHSHHL